ncbi:adenylate kinase [Ancylobacter sp. A5.8]|uniref:adenylate kinase n=1 Tax=Ancylobacter gelatini TaxID=2919920 RepID=UPI001F4E85DD|nr:adenylate kinase [Ancylobacter gelatini]MCJ8142713.1 adenylate kinase [Ancylobacter gelatini]
MALPALTTPSTGARATRLYFTGASCAGVTTLGRAVARRLGLRHVDVDAFYWAPTDPPYTVKNSPEQRVAGIAGALGADGWVLTGAFDGWGDALIADVDLIVFVATDTALRMERLAARERQRHGARIDPGGDMHAAHLAFRRWAEGYDTPGFDGRNRARHEAWLARQRAPVLRADGADALDDLVARVLDALTGLA